MNMWQWLIYCMAVKLTQSIASRNVPPSINTLPIPMSTLDAVSFNGVLLL